MRAVTKVREWGGELGMDERDLQEIESTTLGNWLNKGDFRVRIQVSPFIVNFPNRFLPL